LMDTTNFYIALYDEERDEVSFPIYAEGDQIRTAGSRRAGHGMTEYIIHSRQPLLLEDNVVERQAALGIESIGTASQSWLGVPMMVGDRVVGVAAVQSYTTPRVYDERDRDLLSAIASQTAVVIENARLLQEAQTRAVRERTVRTITDRISRGMSREEIETNKFMIHAIDFILMIFSIIAISLFIFGLYVSSRSSVEAARLIMGGEFSFLFWGLVIGIGILLPLALELYELFPRLINKVELRAHNPWISGAVTASVLLGGFVLRYVVVYAGQMAKIIPS